jgi:chorismate-pyruvate lyase
MVDGQWLTVDTVMETERPDGRRYIYLYFVDHRPAIAAKTDLVRSRIPEQAR